MISSRNKSQPPAEPRSIVAGVPIETSAGIFVAAFSESGLLQLRFPRNSATPRSQPLASHAQSWLKTTARALESILIGRTPQELPPLDWAGASDFQRRVWSAMLEIPTGKTRTYSEIAALIGSPNATRAVGNACGANPIPVLVPCHRVTASGGKLGGFSGGLDWKRRLLAAEKIPLF